MTTTQPTAIGVLTSGGDAPGMNAALRAVVRTGIARGARVFAIQEGYQGMVAGGNLIRELRWGDVGGILQRGGTVIGTARCAEFRTREGRLRAAKNLVERGIDRLVVIGGDGSLTGADTFRREWASLLGELTETVVITAAQAAAHPALGVVGLVGSIDNDFSRTDMTIGADTALHRITAAIDDLSSTAASHQCTFVIEAMGRHCGYLALMGGVSGGADWVFIPENPPASDDWPAQMCEVIRAGREAGRRDSIIIVAEGAQDRHGNPIASAQVQSILKERLGVDTRVTILGHVQRGGSPSAFDRWMSTLVGYAAIDDLLDSPPEAEPQVIGVRYNRIRRTPLMEAVEATRAVGAAITAQEYDTAMGLRGGSFTEMFGIFQAMAYALPSVDRPRPRRIGILNAGGPAPGMNTAVRAAVRLALDQGHAVTGIYNGFEGLIDGQVEEFNWGSVDGWGPRGGSELGTSRRLPIDAELAAVARTIETHKIAALLVIGGWTSYVGAAQLEAARDRYPAFNIPILCLPATIDNNLPGSELSIGADTALNSIVEAVDKIKTTAVASRRCFVVEVMGRECGYLALMSGLATGAEQVYLPETGITLDGLRADLEEMIASFTRGKRLSLLIRNEHANALYTTGFLAALFEEEGKELFDVRQAILGHLQQGGSPSPYDRIQATRLAARSVAFFGEQFAAGGTAAACIGVVGGHVRITPLAQMPELWDAEHRRPREQWWLELLPMVRALAEEPAGS